MTTRISAADARRPPAAASPQLAAGSEAQQEEHRETGSEHWRGATRRIACRAGGAVAAGARTVWTSGLTSDGSGVTSLTSSPTTVDPDWGGGAVGRTRGTLVARFLDAVVRWAVDAWDAVLGEGVVAVDVLVDVVVVVVELVVVVVLPDVVD